MDGLLHFYSIQTHDRLIANDFCRMNCSTGHRKDIAGFYDKLFPSHHHLEPPEDDRIHLSTLWEWSGKDVPGE